MTGVVRSFVQPVFVKESLYSREKFVSNTGHEMRTRVGEVR